MSASTPFTKNRRTHRPGPGTFQITRGGGRAFLTYPCPHGALTGDGATHFEADDGRSWSVEWYDVQNGRTRFLLPADFAA